jgi:hypothetical protein
VRRSLKASGCWRPSDIQSHRQRQTVGLSRPELLKHFEKSDSIAIPSCRRCIDTKLLTVVIAHHEAGFLFFDGPRRREAARMAYLSELSETKSIVI